MSIYQQRLIDHYRHPRYSGVLECPDFSSGVVNPSCGDSISLMGIIKDEVIISIAFQGSGCVISQAAASLLMETVIGLSLDEALAINSDRMCALVGIDLGPVRLKCALLCRDALHQALIEYKSHKEVK